MIEEEDVDMGTDHLRSKREKTPKTRTRMVDFGADNFDDEDMRKKK